MRRSRRTGSAEQWAAGRRGQSRARSTYRPVTMHKICIMFTSDAHIASEVTYYGHASRPAKVWPVHESMPHGPVEAEIDL